MLSFTFSLSAFTFPLGGPTYTFLLLSSIGPFWAAHLRAFNMCPNLFCLHLNLCDQGCWAARSSSLLVNKLRYWHENDSCKHRPQVPLRCKLMHSASLDSVAFLPSSLFPPSPISLSSHPLTYFSACAINPIERVELHVFWRFPLSCVVFLFLRRLYTEHINFVSLCRRLQRQGSSITAKASRSKLRWCFQPSAQQSWVCPQPALSGHGVRLWAKKAERGKFRYSLWCILLPPNPPPPKKKSGLSSGWSLISAVSH